jgi:hypothetical protein
MASLEPYEGCVRRVKKPARHKRGNECGKRPGPIPLNFRNRVDFHKWATHSGALGGRTIAGILVLALNFEESAKQKRSHSQLRRNQRIWGIESDSAPDRHSTVASGIMQEGSGDSARRCSPETLSPDHARIWFSDGTSCGQRALTVEEIPNSESLPAAWLKLSLAASQCAGEVE